VFVFGLVDLFDFQFVFLKLEMWIMNVVKRSV
jgi:hypothetical protein